MVLWGECLEREIPCLRSRVTSNFEMRASGEGLVSLLACMMAILRMNECVIDNVGLEVFLGKWAEFTRRSSLCI
jgi:hypothetical protein